MHDYNDNTGLCSGRGVRGGAQYPLRGAQVFRVKFFLRRCGSGRDHLLARLSCLYAPIQKGGGGQQVAASTSLAIAFFFIVISRVHGLSLCTDGRTNPDDPSFREIICRDLNFLKRIFLSKEKIKIISPVVKVKIKVKIKGKLKN